MPGFDGTGPWGEGPLSGGGRGYCVGRFQGRGGGRRGRGRGWSAAPAWGRPYPVVDETAYPPSAPAGLSAELEALRARVAELERAQGQND